MNEAVQQFYSDDRAARTFFEFSSVNQKYHKPDTSVTGDMIGFYLDRTSRQKVKKYPLWGIKYNNSPLSVDLIYESGSWNANLDWLNIYGYGRSPEEAIDEVRQHIEYFVNFYNKMEEKDTVGFAKELKTKFSKIQQL